MNLRPAFRIPLGLAAAALVITTALSSTGAAANQQPAGQAGVEQAPAEKAILFASDGMRPDLATSTPAKAQCRL
jgi:hypothetical protein